MHVVNKKGIFFFSTFLSSPQQQQQVCLQFLLLLQPPFKKTLNYSPPQHPTNKQCSSVIKFQSLMRGEGRGGGSSFNISHLHEREALVCERERGEEEGGGAVFFWEEEEEKPHTIPKKAAPFPPPPPPFKGRLW